MANLRDVNKNLGITVCRRCIGRAYNVKLLPKDCIYDDYPQMCICCRKVHNIVVGFKFSGKIKMLFK